MKKVVPAPRPSLKHRKINRDDISEPRDFRHIGHVGYGHTYSALADVQPQEQLSPVGDHSNEVHMPVGYEKGATQEIGFEIHLDEVNLPSTPKTRLTRKASRKAAKDPEYVSNPACFQHLAHIEDTHSNEKNFVVPKAVGDQTIRNMFYVVDRNIAAGSSMNSTSDQSATLSRSSPNMETNRKAMLPPNPAKQNVESGFPYVPKALPRKFGNQSSREAEQNMEQTSALDDAYCLPRGNKNMMKLQVNQYEDTEKQKINQTKENNIVQQGNVRLRKVDIPLEDRVPLPTRRKVDATLSVDSQDIPTPITPFTPTFHPLPEEITQKAAYESVVEIKGEQPISSIASRRHKRLSSAENNTPNFENTLLQRKQSDMNFYIDNANHSRTLPTTRKKTIEQQVRHPIVMTNTKRLGASEGSQVNELGATITDPKSIRGDERRIRNDFNEWKSLPIEKIQSKQISTSNDLGRKVALLHPINSGNTSGELKLAIEELDNILDEHVSSSTTTIRSSEQRPSDDKPSDTIEKLSVKELTKILSANKTTIMGIYGREFKRAKTLGEQSTDNEYHEDTENEKINDEETPSTISKVQRIGVNMFMPYDERTITEIIAQKKIRKVPPPPPPIPATRKPTVRKVESETKQENAKNDRQPEQDVINVVLNVPNDLPTSIAALNKSKQALKPPNNTINQSNERNENLKTSTKQQSIIVDQKDSLSLNMAKEMKETCSTLIENRQHNNENIIVGEKNTRDIAALKATQSSYVKVQTSSSDVSKSIEECINNDLKSHRSGTNDLKSYRSGTLDRRSGLSHLNPSFSKSCEILHMDNETSSSIDCKTYQPAKLDYLKYSNNEKQLNTNSEETNTTTNKSDSIIDEKRTKINDSMRKNEKQANTSTNYMTDECINTTITEFSNKNSQHIDDIHAEIVQNQSLNDHLSMELKESEQKTSTTMAEQIVPANRNTDKIELKYDSKDGDCGNKLDNQREMQQFDNSTSLSNVYPSKQCCVVEKVAKPTNRNLSRAKTCEVVVVKNTKTDIDETNINASMKIRDVPEKKKVLGVIVVTIDENYRKKSSIKSIIDKSQKQSITEETQSNIKEGETISIQGATKLNNNCNGPETITKEQTKIGSANTRSTITRTMSTPIYQTTDEIDTNTRETTVQRITQRHSMVVNSNVERAKLAKQKHIPSCCFEANDSKGKIKPESSQAMETSSPTIISSNFATTLEIGEEIKDEYLKVGKNKKSIIKDLKTTISSANSIKEQDKKAQTYATTMNNNQTTTNKTMISISSSSKQTIHKEGNDVAQSGKDISKPTPRGRLMIQQTIHKLPYEDVKGEENSEKRQRPIPAPRRSVTQTLTQPETSSEISKIKSMGVKVTKLAPETMVADKQKTREMNELPTEAIAEEPSELNASKLVSSTATTIINVTRDDARDEWVLRF